METGDEGGHYCLFVVFLVLVSFGGVFDLRVEGVFGDGCRSWRGMRVEEGCWLYKVRQGPRFDLFTTYLTLPYAGNFLIFVCGMTAALGLIQDLALLLRH